MDVFLAPKEVDGGLYLAPLIPPEAASVDVQAAWTETLEVVSAQVQIAAVTVAVACTEALEVVQASVYAQVSAAITYTEVKEVFSVVVQGEPALEPAPANSYTGVLRLRTYVGPIPKE